MHQAIEPCSLYTTSNNLKTVDLGMAYASQIKLTQSFRFVYYKMWLVFFTIY